MARIQRLFAAAASNGIRRPRISLRVPVTFGTQPETIVPLTLTPAPQHGRHPGSIYVSSGQRRAQRVFVGSISPQCAFIRSHAARDEHAEAVRAFGSDPIRIARAHGHATGACCFCGRELTDARSVAMGYGPICAEHYALEWGDQRTSSVVELDGPTDAAQAQAREAAMNRMRQRGARRRTAPDFPPFVRPRRPTPAVEAVDQSMQYDDEDNQFM